MKMAPKSAMRASIGTFGQIKARAENCIYTCASAVKNATNAGLPRRGLIPGRIDITERPAVVDKKARVGDWELDSIIGAKHKGAITSMVERKTRLTRLVLLDGATSKATKAGIIACLEPLKAHVLTLTSDNGKEFASHSETSEELDSGFYFAPPATVGSVA